MRMCLTETLSCSLRQSLVTASFGFYSLCSCRHLQLVCVGFRQAKALLAQYSSSSALDCGLPVLGLMLLAQVACLTMVFQNCRYCIFLFFQVLADARAEN